MIFTAGSQETYLTAGQRHDTVRATNEEGEYRIMAALERSRPPRRWRWAIPLYALAAPFEALVVVSALQVGSRPPNQILIMQLGLAHLLPIGTLALASFLMVGLGWVIDRPFRLVVPRVASSRVSRTIQVEPSAASALPIPEFEEPTMIMHALVIPTDVASDASDQAGS